MGSDGESEEGSRNSEQEVVSPASRGTPNAAGGAAASGVKMRQKPGQAGPQQAQQLTRKLSSQEEINKRLSLPADLKLPDNFVEKLAVSPTLDGPLTRATRRQSLSEIGFGRMDTYTKLDKLGEVSAGCRESRFCCALSVREAVTTCYFFGGHRPCGTKFLNAN